MSTIINMTRVWPGTAATVLRTVLRTIPGSVGSPTEVLAFPQQQATLTELGTEHGVVVSAIKETSAEWAVIGAIAEAVQRMLERSSDDVRVYSFSPGVKHMVASFGGRVSFTPLSPYARTDAQRSVWDSTFMPEDDAVRALARAVASRSSGAVNKTDLRPLLENVDRAFSKEPGGYASSVGFISTLLALAEKRGVVTLAGDEPRITVALTEAGRRLLVGREHAVGRTAEGTSGEISDQGDDAPSGSRSDGFLALWRTANLGPFMSVRVAVYDEVDRSFSAGPRKLKTLVSDAVKAVREATPDGSPTFPWSRVTLLIETLMRRRPVARSDGEYVARTWANGDRVITAMAEEWQFLLDGELVLHLIDNGVELRIDDMPDLGGALYNGRFESDIERAYEVLRRLIQDGLLVEGAPEESLRRRSVANDAGEDLPLRPTLDTPQMDELLEPGAPDCAPLEHPAPALYVPPYAEAEAMAESQ